MVHAMTEPALRTPGPVTMSGSSLAGPILAHPMALNRYLSTGAILGAAAIDKARPRGRTIESLGPDAVQYAARSGDWKPEEWKLHPVRHGHRSVIMVDGPVMNDDLWAMIMDGTLTSELVAAIHEAKNDETSTELVLDLDTPGGMVAGVTDILEAIGACRAVKPVRAFIHSNAHSLGYWIAAVCDSVHATPEATAGSIGAISVYYDTSEQAAESGMRAIPLTSDAPHKAMGVFGVPIEEGMIGSEQRIIDRMGAMFRADVTAHRGISEADLVAMGGASYFSDDLGPMGLIDGVMTTAAYYAADAAALDATVAPNAPQAAPPTPPSPESASGGAPKETAMSQVDELTKQYEELSEEEQQEFRKGIDGGEDSEKEEPESTTDSDEDKKRAANDDPDKEDEPSAQRVTIPQAKSILKDAGLPEHTVNALALESQEKNWDKADTLQAAIKATKQTVDAPDGSPEPLGGARASKGNGTATADYKQAIDACMASHNLSKAQATVRVASEQPELYDAYLAEANADRKG